MSLAHLYGALLGLGVLCAYFGFKRLVGARTEEGARGPDRRNGLIMVNLGVLLAVASLALTIWGT